MSSHHIVREKQEPALFIISLEGFSTEWLGQLLEWSPTVMVAGAAMEKVQIYGIKTDIVIGANGTQNIQNDVRFIDCAGQPALNAGLDYLISQHYPAVNVIDKEFEVDIYRPYLKQLDMVIYKADKKIFAVHTGFSKWKPAGQGVEILEHPDNFLYTNLQKEPNNNFKTINDGLITLHFDNHNIFIAEQL